MVNLALIGISMWLGVLEWCNNVGKSFNPGLFFHWCGTLVLLKLIAYALSEQIRYWLANERHRRSQGCAVGAPGRIKFLGVIQSGKICNFVSAPPAQQVHPHAEEEDIF